MLPCHFFQNEHNLDKSNAMQTVSIVEILKIVKQLIIEVFGKKPIASAPPFLYKVPF